MDVQTVIEEFKTITFEEADAFFGRLLAITPEYSGEFSQTDVFNIAIAIEAVTISGSFSPVIQFMKDHKWVVPFLCLVFAFRINKWDLHPNLNPNAKKVFGLMYRSTETGTIMGDELAKFNKK